MKLANKKKLWIQYFYPKRLGLSLGLGVFIFASALHVFGEHSSFVHEKNCRIFEPYFKVLENPPRMVDSRSRWRDYQVERSSVLVEVASHVVSSYLQDEVALSFSTECIENAADRSVFESRLSSLFFSQSIARLFHSNIPQVRALLTSLGINDADLIPTLIFKIEGYCDHKHSHERVAGFHRKNGSLFMNFSKIPRNEWYFIFLHELAHANDPILTKASEYYSHEERIKKVANEAAFLNEIESPRFSHEARQWLLAGLHRGYLAEVRAWSFNAKVYEAGIEEGMWGNIAWMEELLSGKDELDSLEQHITKVLHPRFLDPQKGIFSHPSLQKALQIIRDDILEGKLHAWEFILEEES